MKALAWYSIVIIGLSIVFTILMIGEWLEPMTPVEALVGILLTVPVLMLAILVIRQPR